MTPSRPSGRWLIPVLVALLASLVSIANATPPDPSWIRGVYDDDDFDSVVVLVAGSVGILAAPVLDGASLLVPLPGGLPAADPERATSAVPALRSARAPPIA